MSKIKQISVYGENGWSQPYNIGADASNVNVSIADGVLSTATNVAEAMQLTNNNIAHLYDTIQSSVREVNGSVANLTTSVENLSAVATTSSNGLMSAEDKIKLNNINPPLFSIQNFSTEYSLNSAQAKSISVMGFQWSRNLQESGFTPVSVMEIKPGQVGTSPANVAIRGIIINDFNPTSTIGRVQINLKNLTETAIPPAGQEAPVLSGKILCMRKDLIAQTTTVSSPIT